ncbi:dihydroorotase [Chloroflexota bacterium]
MNKDSAKIKSLLIQEGRIIDPGQGIDEIGSLLIKEGKISWFGKGNIEPPSSDFDIIPAKGLIVCPGFIDIHCHLRQPGFEDKETIATGTKAAAKGGFSTICCMPNTVPPLDNRDSIRYVIDEAEKIGSIRVLPVGCISKGRRGEELAPMKEMADAGATGFSDDGDPVMNDDLMLEALRISSEIGLPVIDHCEHTGMTEGGVMNQGKVSDKLGLKGMPSASEDIMVARDIDLARLGGVHLHIAHVSTAESVNIIRRAKKAGIKVTAEVTPHHLILSEDTITGYNTSAKVNPPLRTDKDISALIEGINDNTIDAIATDHAPHTGAEKQQSFSDAPFGISGFETALGSLMSLVHSEKLSLNTLISKLTCEPARIIANRQANLGTLAVGDTADIAIFHPDIEWLVKTDDFVSKGKNTPLAGARLKGKVMATIYQGKISYKDTSIKIVRVK